MNPLEQALEQLRQALVEFVFLLEREAGALTEGRTDDLPALIVEKTRWSETANTAWNHLVVASGIDIGQGESLDGLLSGTPALQSGWREVRQLAEKAERINLVNSTLIEAQLQRTRQALDVLQSAANRSALYGANGRIVDGFQSGHTLDKA
ncbi:MAG: flagellar protein FlgN [Hydrogenophilaceae bacterium]